MILHYASLKRKVSPSCIPDNQYVLELLKQAAELGYAPSQHRLAACHEFGLLECKVDSGESVKYY